MQFQVLAEEDRGKRWTLVDALEMLRTKANFEEGDAAEIRLGMLRLPSSVIAYLVCVSFDSAIHQRTFLVRLPTASSVRARFEGKPQLQEFEITRLHGATINGQGHVRLSDGAQVRAVEIVPARLPYNITPLYWAIVRQTVAALGTRKSVGMTPVSSS
jgi:hypothetical protein